MGNTKAIFATATTVATAALTIVACGSDKAKPDAPIVLIDAPVDTTPVADAPPDAPSFDFSCSGNSAPAVSANVTVNGNVEEVAFNGGVSIQPLSGADVTLCKGNCQGGANNLGSGTTDGSGNFSIGPITTGGTAIDGYARVTHTGDRTILGFPAAPVATDITQPVITFQDTIIALLANFGCSQQAGNGMVAMFVTDCMNKPISDNSNLTVSVQQGGSDVGDPPINGGQLSQMAAGFYLICNVPPAAATTVSAKYMNMDLRAHDVMTTAGTTTETIVRPGF
jgi:hypothetical protein